MRDMTTQDERAELVNLYHLARTALAAEPLNRQQRVDRLGWAAKAFHNEHPDISVARAYKDADQATRA